MANYSRVMPTGSANGLPIPVAAVATPGTLLHTAQTGTSGQDEIYLWASNVTAAIATLTIEWGGVTDPGNHLVKAYSIPANSPSIKIADGQNMNNGLSVRAFSGTASAINVTVLVNRLS